MKLTFAVILSLCACGVASAAPAPTSRPARPQSYSDRYSILSQRNIFLKDRSRGSSGRDGDGRNGSSTQPSTQPSRRPIEESMVLTGIVEEGGEFRAYVEDQLNSAIIRVSTGDRLAHGTVARIGLDSIEYEQGGSVGGATNSTTSATAPAAARKTMVAIGSDLTGREVAFSIGAFSAGAEGGNAAAGATTGPVMPTGVQGLNPNDPNLTMEQRLKLRRMQELKK